MLVWRRRDSVALGVLYFTGKREWTALPLYAVLCLLSMVTLVAL